LLLLFTAGCSRSITLQIPSQTLTVETFSQGKAVQRCSVAPGSEKFRKLSQLMQQSVAGWRSRSADYVPSIVVIAGDISLYFMGDSVVVSYSGGEYSRSIAAGSYAFLNCKAP
jgi:hypothetical protein